MKIEEAYILVVEQTLEENILKRTLAASALVGASLMPMNSTTKYPVELNTQSIKAQKSTFDPQHSIKHLVDTYKLAPEKAKHIVDLAIKYGKPTFPKPQNLLGTIGVESSFNENAKSGLKYDPAQGLMQIRPKVTGIHASELTDAEGQIKHGAELLHQLYTKTGDIDKSIQAYNIGLTSYNRGNRALGYLEKTKKETDKHDVTKSTAE